LTEVDSLKSRIKFLEKLLEALPWLENALAQLAPLMLLILNTGILPQILKGLSRIELPVSAAALESSAFIKMSMFAVSLYSLDCQCLRECP
jgi:hypothetical protein